MLLLRGWDFFFGHEEAGTFFFCPLLLWLPGPVSVYAAASYVEVEEQGLVRICVKLCAALWRFAGVKQAEYGAGWLQKDSLVFFLFPFLAKGLPASLLLHPLCSPCLLSIVKGHKHCKNTVFPRASPDKLVPQGLWVSYIHFCSSQLLFRPQLLHLSSVAAQSCSSSKPCCVLKVVPTNKSHFEPMALMNYWLFSLEAMEWGCVAVSTDTWMLSKQAVNRTLFSWIKTLELVTKGEGKVLNT